MKKRRMTPRLVEQMQESALNRSLGSGLLLGFIDNVGRQVHTMHHVIQTTEDEELLQAAASHFVCGLVSCWETFFRDLFIEVVKERRDLIERFAGETEAETEGLADEMAAELISKSYNFQNLQGIDRAFSPIFGAQFLSRVATHVFPAVAFGGEVTQNFSLARGVENWNFWVEYCFDERHRITHDANYLPHHVPAALLRVELVFVLFPQIIVAWFELEYCRASVPRGSVVTFLRPMDLLAEGTGFIGPDGSLLMAFRDPTGEEEPQG